MENKEVGEWYWFPEIGGVIPEILICTLGLGGWEGGAMQQGWEEHFRPRVQPCTLKPLGWTKLNVFGDLCGPTLVPKGKNGTNWDWRGGQRPGPVEVLHVDIGNASYIWNAMRSWMILNQFMLLEDYSHCCLKWGKRGSRASNDDITTVVSWKVMVIYSRWGKIRSLHWTYQICGDYNKFKK